MNAYQKRSIAKQVETVISALREINYQCEKSINLCDDIAAGYPMEKSLDEMIMEFCYWKECIEDVKSDD